MPKAPKNSWTQLYERFGEAEKHREELLRRRDEEREALREFEEWCQRAVKALFEDLFQAAERHSDELQKRTGQRLQVEYPAGSPVVASRTGPEIRFLRLGLSEAQLHIYSSHARGGLTHIHLLPSRTVSLKENHRLVSAPGAFLVRVGHDGYELRHLRGDPEGEAGAPMTLDTLVFRAFDLLLSAWIEAETEWDGLAAP